MNDPLTQFELLLDAGKIEEAKAMLETLAARELTEEERSEAKVLMARLYVKLTNAVNQDYLDTVKEAIDQLKDLETREKAFIEKVKLAKTRMELAK